jgi:ribose transport system permease protein
MSRKSREAGVFDRLGNVLGDKVILLLFALIAALFVFGEIVSSGFLTFEHAGAVLRTASFLGIAAIGQTLVILTAGIDLAVGPLITMGNVFTCMFMNGLNENNLWTLLAILGLGVAFGALSGLGVTRLNISPLVMTLATGSLVTGVTLIFSQGAPKGLASPLLRHAAVGNLFSGVPIVVLIWLVLGFFVHVYLRRSVFGRKLYYVGANEKAAFLSGVRVKRVKTLAYMASGATATLSGALMAGYTHTAFLGIGNEYTLWSITAVVIGGTALTGGKGVYLGTIAGAVILVLLESILTILKMPEAGRRIANGLIILIMISVYFSRRNSKA